jgi:hypothetical protein
MFDLGSECGRRGPLVMYRSLLSDQNHRRQDSEMGNAKVSLYFLKTNSILEWTFIDHRISGLLQRSNQSIYLIYPEKGSLIYILWR